VARRRLGEILVDGGVLSEEQLRTVLRAQRSIRRPLGALLIEQGIIGEAGLVQALAMQLELPVVDLDATPLAPEALARVTIDLARKHGLVAFALDGRNLSVAIADPTDTTLRDVLQVQLGVALRVHVASPSALERALERAYG
jgi:type IV pilus assembly protein PilB